MNQVQIDIEHRLLARFMMDDMLVPDFFEEGLWLVGDHNDFPNSRSQKTRIVWRLAAPIAEAPVIIGPRLFLRKFPFQSFLSEYWKIQDYFHLPNAFTVASYQSLALQFPL